MVGLVHHGDVVGGDEQAERHVTPDAKGSRVLEVLDRVQAAPFWRNKKAGTTFGPYPLTWERRDDDEATRLLDALPAGEDLAVDVAIEAAHDLDSPERHDICRRLQRLRNIRGEDKLTRERLGEVIRDVLRSSARLGPRNVNGHRIMTISRAKNREFPQVLVLWPQSVAGDIDHQRRLLYNAITRAKSRCVVVVFGKGRTSKPPFAPD